MRRGFSRFGLVLGGLFLAGVAMAEDSGTAMSGSTGLWAIASGLAMGLSALGGTLAQGRAAGSALEGITRNPGSAGAAFTPMLLALALIEFQTILGFIIAVLWWVK